MKEIMQPQSRTFDITRLTEPELSSLMCLINNEHPDMNAEAFQGIHDHLFEAFKHINIILGRGDESPDYALSGLAEMIYNQTHTDPRCPEDKTTFYLTPEQTDLINCHNTQVEQQGVESDYSIIPIELATKILGPNKNTRVNSIANRLLGSQSPTIDRIIDKNTEHSRKRKQAETALEQGIVITSDTAFKLLDIIREITLKNMEVQYRDTPTYLNSVKSNFNLKWYNPRFTELERIKTARETIIFIKSKSMGVCDIRSKEEGHGLSWINDIDPNLATKLVLKFNLLPE